MTFKLFAKSKMPQVIKLGAFPFKLAFQNWANNPLFFRGN
ncbi:hypothetical protein I600_3245 [Maribacter dokdonensis DSW-8]|nr:hypothetical protein I600_3245 [Maribacter dokdonensis DSW-8]